MTHLDSQIASLKKQLADAYVASRAPNSAQGFSLSEQGRKSAQARAVVIQTQIASLEAQKVREDIVNPPKPIINTTSQQMAIQESRTPESFNAVAPGDVTTVAKNNNMLLIGLAVALGLILL